MGYTAQGSGFLVGLGVSSISDTGKSFAQNAKRLHDYYDLLNKGGIPVVKGLFLTEEDEAFRKYIMDISCKGETVFLPRHLPLLEEFTFPKLEELQRDGLIEWNRQGLSVTEQGHFFIRNICSAFDLHLLRSQPHRTVFSQAI